MKMTKTGKTSVDYISYKRKKTDGASGNNGEWQQAERVVKDTLQDIGKKIEASDHRSFRTSQYAGDFLCRHFVVIMQHNHGTVLKLQRLHRLIDQPFVFCLYNPVQRGNSVGSIRPNGNIFFWYFPFPLFCLTVRGAVKYLKKPRAEPLLLLQLADVFPEPGCQNQSREYPCLVGAISEAFISTERNSYKASKASLSPLFSRRTSSFSFTVISSFLFLPIRI